MIWVSEAQEWSDRADTMGIQEWHLSMQAVTDDHGAGYDSRYCKHPTCAGYAATQAQTQSTM